MHAEASKQQSLYIVRFTLVILYNFVTKLCHASLPEPFPGTSFDRHVRIETNTWLFTRNRRPDF